MNEDEKMNEKKKINSQSVENILKNFKKNLYGIEYYFDKFGGIAQGTDIDEVKKNEEFLDSCFMEIGIDRKDLTSKKNTENITADQLVEILVKYRNKPKISTKNFEILSRSSFLMLNNYFEYLLSDLLSYHYNKFQKSLNEKKFNLALKEINEYETIEEVTKALITKEVESMMVEMSFDELLEHFHSTLGIDNEKAIINWKLIGEFRERRHLIVHNSSLVNKKYIVRTGNPFNLQIGETVNIDTEYFNKACKEFYLSGLLLSYNCWGKWDKEESNNAIFQMLTDCFDLLKLKDYELVTRFTDFTQKIEARNDNQEDYLLRTKVNRLIALKKLSNTGLLSKELKKIKTGTLSPIFKLAFAILSDNYKDIIDLVKQAKSLEDIDLNKYHEWPIYDFIRDNEELNAQIENELIKTISKATRPKTVVKRVKKVPVQTTLN